MKVLLKLSFGLQPRICMGRLLASEAYRLGYPGNMADSQRCASSGRHDLGVLALSKIAK